MAQQQNVAYYDGVPYLSKLPQRSGYTGGGLADIVAQYSDPYAGMGVEQLVQMGMLSPLQQQQKAAPTPTRPPTRLSTIPQAGWGGQASGGGSLADILNGAAPQFGTPTPQVAQAPVQGGQTLAPQFSMPSPAKPQRNFDMFAQNEMAKVLNPQGGM